MWLPSSLAGIAALVLPLLGAAQTAQDVRVGHWVDLKGELDERGIFQASAIALEQPGTDEELIGTVVEIKTRERFVVLGQEIHVDGDTEWQGLGRGDLDGARIKVEGTYKGPRNFSADEIQLRDPGRDRLSGRVDSIEAVPGGFLLRIMSFEVFVAQDLELELEDSLDMLALAPQRLYESTRFARDEDDDFRGLFTIGDSIRIGGQLEWNSDFERNYDLNDHRRRDRTDHEASLRLEGTWTVSDRLFFLAGGRTRYRWRNEEDGGDLEGETSTLTELYGYFADLYESGVDLQLGRQDFDEEREWLYDQNLDAARVIYGRKGLRAELSLSTVLSDGGPVDEDSRNLIAYVSNNDFEKHLAAYAISRQVVGSSDHGTHLGARALGRFLPDGKSWVELAYLIGKRNGTDVRGYGFDVGHTWFPGGHKNVYLTAAYAYGSGDDSPNGGGTDHTFRQTGLHDNNDNFGGVTSFRYYGEIADPELTNLGIATVGVGVRPTQRSSIDLVWHKYDQAEAFNRWVNSDVDRQPDGSDRDLGWEVDLIYGNRERKDLQLEVVLGHYEPGGGFPGNADSAQLIALQIRFKF